jgi:Domain of unknown function (DUF1918)
MPEVGDRVRVESRKLGQTVREGVVTDVRGHLLSVQWSTGEDSTFVPGPGSVTVVGRARARVNKASSSKKTPSIKKATAAKKTAKKTVANKKAVVNSKAVAKKKVVAKKKAVAKKRAVAQKAVANKKGVPKPR